MENDREEIEKLLKLPNGYSYEFHRDEEQQMINVYIKEVADEDAALVCNADKLFNNHLLLINENSFIYIALYILASYISYYILYYYIFNVISLELDWKTTA